MADIFERVLKSPRLPAAAHHPANWPLQMLQEWAEHQAGRAAAARTAIVRSRGFRAARAGLDSYNPDFILIWGDDRYENSREDGASDGNSFAKRFIAQTP